ncbi:alpha/beta fold hydrolase [Silvimonas amylolytica]|uniref:Alpha/beta hydrolase n=1 Tax=Silvimonas amylolytica TaxID=449663 RepID=A0ABQ2PNN0_9NEIS|nr:alpha/beta hydrolase [Silvimonas amylolytica]GGP27199.1 alpha/beta hydrolase [Silvimonas amylolytica]
MVSSPEPEARPWVLLRGLGREARHWGDFPWVLASALGGVQVHAPDLPGNGRWWQERSGLSIKAQREHLREQLATQLAQGPVNVLALSLGGMVALDWASHQPEEIERLVLVNTSMAGIAPFWRRLRWQRYPALLRLVWPSLALRERAILALTSNLPGRREAALPHWLAWQREAPVSATNLLRQLLAAARFQPPALWPGCPTLVVTSAQDRLVDPFCSVQLARAAGWPLQINGHAGHDLPLDDPYWLAHIVAQWQATMPQA